METLFKKNQSRIKGAFASDFFTKRYNDMRTRLLLEIEAERRRNSSIWQLIKRKDNEIANLNAKLRNFAEQDKISNLF